MSACQVCSGKTDTFLCPKHIGDLTKLLTDLPTWLRWLGESAIGQAKLGGGGRGTSRAEPFTGEDQAVSDDVNPAKLQSQFLAAGRVNARASQRLAMVTNTLSTTIRHLCDTRNTPTPHLRNHPGLMAHWLAINVTAIASDETAGECYTDIDNHQKAIEQLINRPVPMRFLGKCPTWSEQTRRACGTELRCREGTIEVTCPTCRRTHNADRLQLLMMGDLERKKLTIDRILELNRTVIPEEFRISERTLRRWRKPGAHGEPPKLKPRGYRRADGREVINRHSDDDEPLFLWSDITRLRGEKPEPKAKAG